MARSERLRPLPAGRPRLVAARRPAGATKVSGLADALDAYPAPVIDGHELSSRSGLGGTEVTCGCGRWDGWYNGARSRRRVLDDWAEHAAAEVRAAGPLRVQSERTDTPKELE